MRRAVQWSRDALDDLKGQISHIATDNPQAARRVAERIQTACESLGDAATGRPGRVTGTYEKSISRLPYVIAYSIALQGEHEVVSILRVIHTARDWPPQNWPE